MLLEPRSTLHIEFESIWIVLVLQWLKTYTGEGSHYHPWMLSISFSLLEKSNLCILLYDLYNYIVPFDVNFNTILWLYLLLCKDLDFLFGLLHLEFFFSLFDGYDLNVCLILFCFNFCLLLLYCINWSREVKASISFIYKYNETEPFLDFIFMDTWNRTPTGRGVFSNLVRGDPSSLAFCYDKFFFS